MTTDPTTTDEGRAAAAVGGNEQMTRDEILHKTHKQMNTIPVWKADLINGVITKEMVYKVDGKSIWIWFDGSPMRHNKTDSFRLYRDSETSARNAALEILNNNLERAQRNIVGYKKAIRNLTNNH